GGSALWKIGSADSLLRAGDSTVAKTLTIRFAKPATHAKLALVFDGMAVVVNLVPAVAPDTVPAWVYDDSSYARSGGGFLRRMLTVLFKVTATQAERQAAVDRINGVVVGGRALPPEDGPYWVKVPWDPTAEQLDSLATVLKGLPQVEAAGLIRRDRGAGRRPDDGPLWAPEEWTFQPDSASGENWALEAVAAPLAWGCSVGDPLTKIMIVDHPFDSTEIKSNVIARTLPYGFDPNNPTRHGTYVSGVLASPGDNGGGMSGMMWKAGLYLDDTGRASAFVDDVILEIRRAAQLGYRIVNLSRDARDTAPPGPADTANVRSDLSTSIPQLRRIPSATFPLVVVSAGNDNTEAWLNTYAALADKDAFPNNFLVVGGSEGRLPRDRWGGASFLFARGHGSNHGRLLDVYAPAVDVSVPELAGAQTVVTRRTGTSYAAPLVSGIAGLLLSFDPDLTPAQLKSLIVEGAAKGGRSMPNDPTKFLANAYESLKLAAQKPGTPICGFPVSLAGDRGSQRVKFERTGGTQDSLQLPIPDGGYTYTTLSVAQGGRLLAVGGMIGEFPEPTPEPGSVPGRTLEYRLVNDQWTLNHTFSGVERRAYLERDTVDQQFECRDYLVQCYYHTTLRRDDGTTQPFAFALTTDPGASNGLWENPASFSSSGDYALVHIESNYQECSSYKLELYLFNTTAGGSGSFNPLLNPLLTTCPAAGDNQPYAEGVAWSAVGDLFLAAFRVPAELPGYSSTNIRSFRQSGGSWPSSDFLLQEVQMIGNGNLAPAGDLLYWTEIVPNASGGGECFLSTRTATVPYSLISRSSLLPSQAFPLWPRANLCPPENASTAPMAALAAGPSPTASFGPRHRLAPRGTVRVRAN
ncbi:MAG TPA: S8 family serine peptidase, partial [Gemmatimonadales bacterium]|nr:S8 family serine peptidase [Gemmatimonadales bacterium]